MTFWLKETLGSSWHWYRYEYAVQRGSIHCHGVAKLKNDPGLCQLGFLAAKHKDTSKETFSKQQLNELANDINQGQEVKRIVCQYADFFMSTLNPCPPGESSVVKARQASLPTILSQFTSNRYA